MGRVGQVLTLFLLLTFPTNFCIQLLSPKFSAIRERRSSISCSRQGVCMLQNVYLDIHNVFHYYGVRSTEAASVLRRLERLRLVAAAQISSPEFNTTLKVVTHLIDPFKSGSTVIRGIEEPVFYHYMVAVGNFGHTLLQNCLPAVVSMHRSVLKHRAYFRTIVANDCKNCGIPNAKSNSCLDGFGSFGYSTCDTLRRNLYALITGYQAQYTRELFSLKSEYIHLSKVVVGFPEDDAFDLLHNPSNEKFFSEKKIVRQRLLSTIACEQASKKRVTVMIYCKDVLRNGRHGNTFVNCSEFTQNMTDFLLKKYQADVIAENFDVTSFRDQIVLLQKADIFVSDGGSSSYYTHLLRDGAISMTFPLCDSSCHCSHFFAERGAYANPSVQHVPIDSKHIDCLYEEGHSGLFMPLYRVRQSFGAEVLQALKRVVPRRPCTLSS